MNHINWQRCLAGGIAAGVFMWIFEGAASFLYMEEMARALETHNLTMEWGTASFVLSISYSLIAGLVLVFFYAAARPRFGPGPKSAIVVAIVYWLGSYFLALMSYHMLGIFPAGMLATWGVIGLVEIILAGLLGGWIYREE